MYVYYLRANYHFERLLVYALFMHLLVYDLFVLTNSLLLYVCIHCLDSPGGQPEACLRRGAGLDSEGGTIRLETLIELKLFNSSFSSSNLSIRACRAYPVIEIRQAAPCRENRGKSSDSRQQYLSQQYPPPLLIYTYIYIYIHIHVYIYIYIYI